MALLKGKQIKEGSVNQNRLDLNAYTVGDAVSGIDPGKELVNREYIEDGTFLSSVAAPFTGTAGATDEVLVRINDQNQLVIDTDDLENITFQGLEGFGIDIVNDTVSVDLTDFAAAPIVQAGTAGVPNEIFIRYDDNDQLYVDADEIFEGEQYDVLVVDNNKLTAAQDVAATATFSYDPTKDRLVAGDGVTISGTGNHNQVFGNGHTLSTNGEFNFIAGDRNEISGGAWNTIISELSTISANNMNTIIGGFTNQISGAGYTGLIIGSSFGTINTSFPQQCQSIISNEDSEINGTSSFVSTIAGQRQTITNSLRSAIIGGNDNTLNANQTVLLGLQNVTADLDNTVYVPNLLIHTTPEIADQTPAGTAGFTGGVLFREEDGRVSRAPLSSQFQITGGELTVDVSAIVSSGSGITVNGDGTVDLGGTLDANATVDGASTHSVTFDNLTAFDVSSSGPITFTDSGNNGGIQYAADYSADYTDRSLVDKGFVSNLAEPASTTAGAADSVPVRVTDADKFIIDIDDITQAITDSGNSFVQDGSGVIVQSDGTVDLGGPITSSVSSIMDTGLSYLLSANGVGSIALDETDLNLTHSGNTIDISPTELRIGGTISMQTTGSNQVDISDSEMTITSNTGGLKYAANYLDDFTDRSLVDKAYVDSLAAGLDVKESVRAATTSDIGGTYSFSAGTQGGADAGSFTGAATSIDGVTLSTGDRVLIKDQTDNTQNGIYEYQGGGEYIRAEDSDGTPQNEISAGNYTFVEEGTVNAAQGYVLTTDGDVPPLGELVPNVDGMVWTQFSESTNFTGAFGITIAGQDISVDLTDFTSPLAGTAGSANEILVRANDSDQLVIDQDDLPVGAQTGSGITVQGDGTVDLGGTLTANTSVNGDSNTYELEFVNLSGFNVNASSNIVFENTGNGTIEILSSADGNLNIENTGGTTGVLNVISGSSGGMNIENSGVGGLGIVNTAGQLSITNSTSDGTLIQENVGGITFLANGGSLDIITNDQAITITDNGVNGGALYAADYSADFVDRSLVDKAYVDNAIETGSALDAGFGLIINEATTSANRTIEIDIDAFTTPATGTGTNNDQILVKKNDQDQLVIESSDIDAITSTETEIAFDSNAVAAGIDEVTGFETETSGVDWSKLDGPVKVFVNGVKYEVGTSTQAFWFADAGSTSGLVKSAVPTATYTKLYVDIDELGFDLEAGATPDRFEVQYNLF